MHWLIVRYQPTGLFSLKHGDATSTGGKSLLVPTPFAIRTALLDVAIRIEGIQSGPQAFDNIKSLQLAMRPPDYAAVANIFVKVIKPERNPKEKGREMASTIAFREYVHLFGEMALAFGGGEKILEVIAPWLMQINYFGKRGSFYQPMDLPQRFLSNGDEPPSDFVHLVGLNLSGVASGRQFPLGTLQRIDEWGETLTFDKMNIYNRDSRAKIELGKDRVRMDVVLPYRQTRASRGYTLYERM